MSELIQAGRSQASMSFMMDKPTSTHVLIGLEGTKKTIKLDGKAISSKLKYPYLGCSVSFVPDDLSLLKGSPESRRDYLDSLGVSLDPLYFKVLQKFEKSLKQRNQLLKMIRDGERRFEEYSVWTEEFVQSAVPVYANRFEIIERLNDTLPLIYKRLFNTQETISVSYEHRLENPSDIATALFAKINQLSEAERAVGRSLAGPHRDDLHFQIDQMDGRSYASQGQIRGMVIALKVAQLELSRAARNGSPILLLDDIISELDDRRVEALVEFLSGYPGQLFVTTAETSKVHALHRKFSGFKVVDLASKNPQKEGLNEPVITCS